MNPLLEHTHTLTADGRKALAARVEAATDGAVLREQCCVACGRCDLAKKARTGAAFAALGKDPKITV